MEETDSGPVPLTSAVSPLLMDTYMLSGYIILLLCSVQQDLQTICISKKEGSFGFAIKVRVHKHTHIHMLKAWYLGHREAETTPIVL